MTSKHVCSHCLSPVDSSGLWQAHEITSVADLGHGADRQAPSRLYDLHSSADPHFEGVGR